MKKDMIHYLKDFPVEVILQHDKIVEQLILYGNSNDLDLKRAVVPMYKQILKKMLLALKDQNNLSLLPVKTSDISKNHLHSRVDAEHIRISYPSLDLDEYSKQRHESRQNERKSYSFLNLLDAIVKNCFNMCTDDVLISQFCEIIAHYVVPLLKLLRDRDEETARRLVFSYLGIFRKLMEHTDLADKRQVLFVVPVIRISLILLRVIGTDTITNAEFLASRGYFVLLFDAHLRLLLPKSEFTDCLALLTTYDPEVGATAAEVDKLLLAIEYLRDLEKAAKKQDDHPNAYLSDKLEEFKQTHAKLKKAACSVFFSKDAEGIVDLFITNHLRSVLLQDKGEMGEIDPGFNHYESSVELMSSIISEESESLLLHMIKSFHNKLESTHSIGFPGMAKMAKDLAYTALMDKRFSDALLMAGLYSTNPAISDAAYVLLTLLTKRSIDKGQIENSPIVELLPLVIKDAKTLPRARGLLEMLTKRSKKFLIHYTFIGSFSQDKKSRSECYSTIFKLEFFDQCLSFNLSADSRSPGEASALDLSPLSAEFLDPLDGIVDNSGSKIAYQGRLSVFKEKEGKLGRITQAQIKSLFELLSIALNDNLEYNVRCVALDQIGEALYFYRDSPALKEFCHAMIKVCFENFISFGNNRENFSMVIAKLRPLDESFISTKSAKDLPIQNKHYAHEKMLTSKYLLVFNTIMQLFRQVADVRAAVLDSIFTDSKNKGVCRTLWILSTEKNLEYRYQALLTLNMIFFGSDKLHANIIFSANNSNSSAQPSRASLESPTAGLYVTKPFSDNFVILFQGIDYKHTAIQPPLTGLEPNRKEMVLKFIEMFIGIGKGPEGGHYSFDPETNKDKLEEMVVSRAIDNAIGTYVNALKNNKSIEYFDMFANQSLIGSFLYSPIFFESKSIWEGYLDQLRDSLQRGNDETFVAANNILSGIINSREFKHSYSVLSAEQNFMHATVVYYHEKILPLLYEYHIDKFAEKHSVIIAVFGFIKDTVKLALKVGDHNLLAIIRGFITRQSFIELLGDLLRKYESMDIINTLLVAFLRWHFDLFLKRTTQNAYIASIEFLFDSALICTRTDNFFGMSRLINVLKLAHAMSCKNPYLSLDSKKAINPDIKQMNHEEAHLSARLKASTVAWIVSLLDHRSVRVRMLCWSIITNYLDTSLLELFPSLVDNSIVNLSLVNESVGVLSLGYFFLFKVARMLRTREQVDPDKAALTTSKDIFVKVMHQRKGIDGIRKMLAQQSVPDVYIANIARFLIEWIELDRDSIFNKYFHTDVLEKICDHLAITESDTKIEVVPNILKRLCDKTNKATTLVSLLQVSCSGQPSNAKAFVKNFEGIQKIVQLLEYVGNLLRQQIVFDGQLEAITSVHGKVLDAAIKELCFNCITLLETLLKECEEFFYVHLNEYENDPDTKSILSTLESILAHDSNDSRLGYVVLKYLAKLLLRWPKGYKIIDEYDDSNSSIADSLINRCMCFFKAIDYTKITEKDYLEIINSEELLHILAVLIARSDLMKLRFLNSGLFGLYVSKFGQIIHSFKKESPLILVGPERKEAHDKTISNSSSSFSKQASRLAKSSAVTISKKSMGTSGEKDKVNPQTKSSKLNQNIRSITENSAGHIRAYIMVAKYFFHNTNSSASKDSNKQNVAALESCMPDLMNAINFLWIEGQHDEDIMTDLLELLINWHMSRDYSGVLFKRIIDQKFNLKQEFHSSFLSFVTCIMSNAQMPSSRVIKFLLVFNGVKEFNWKNERLQAILSLNIIKACKDVVQALTSFLLTCQSANAREDLVLLLANLAFSRIHKVRFDEEKDLLNECLRLMSDDKSPLKLRAICSQFFYNVTHKCTKTIALLNKRAVLDEVRLMIDEGERMVDRLTFDESVAYSSEEKASKVHLVKTLVNNLRMLSSMIGVNYQTN